MAEYNWNKCSLVEIEWLDHAGKAGWQRDVEITPMICRTVGYLLKDDKKFIVVTQDLTENDSYGYQMCIMKNCIKSMKVLNGI